MDPVKKQLSFLSFFLIKLFQILKYSIIYRRWFCISNPDSGVNRIVYSWFYDLNAWFSNSKAVDRKLSITWEFKKDLEIAINPLQRYLSPEESFKIETERILLEFFLILFSFLTGNSIDCSIKLYSIISKCFLLCKFSLFWHIQGRKQGLGFCLNFF